MTEASEETIPKTEQAEASAPAPLSLQEAAELFSLKAEAARESQTARINRASDAQVAAWEEVAKSAIDAPSTEALAEIIRADAENIEVVLSRSKGLSPDSRQERHLLGVLNEALSVLDPEALHNNIESARWLLETNRNRKNQAELDQKAVEANPIDVADARQAVDQAHENDETQRLVSEIVVTARGTVAGSVNTSKRIMEATEAKAAERGRDVKREPRQGWNSWGEAALPTVASPSSEYAHRQARMIREAVQKNLPELEPISEVRIGKERPDGKVELGITILVPGKVDETGRFAANVSVGALVPKELAAKVSQAAQEDPTIARQMAEALMSDYGFSAEVFESIH
jgi:hypothetical protein